MLTSTKYQHYWSNNTKQSFKYRDLVAKQHPTIISIGRFGLWAFISYHIAQLYRITLIGRFGSWAFVSYHIAQLYIQQLIINFCKLVCTCSKQFRYLANSTKINYVHGKRSCTYLENHIICPRPRIFWGTWKVLYKMPVLHDHRLLDH